MWYRIKSFIQFYFRAKTRFNIQSPFLFEFVSHVLDTSKQYYAFDLIETERKKLIRNKNLLIIEDYGAGSSVKNSNARTISDVAATALSGIHKCRILFNLALHYRCFRILELGTSLGISSAYLAKTNRNAHVTTLEGDDQICKIAKTVHDNLELSNIEVIPGKFYDTLPKVLSYKGEFDLVFIDGHHAKNPTLEYYEKIKSKCHQNSIVIFDDIYWSPDMTDAWNQIVKKPEVTLSIDLYDIGIIFFNTALSKENVRYIPYRYKPWKIGLFG